ncbi:hypothetical protein HC928_15990 [bacterium]|nr:hypothetical protein [bacterium]
MNFRYLNRTTALLIGAFVLMLIVAALLLADGDSNLRGTAADVPEATVEPLSDSEGVVVA